MEMIIGGAYQGKRNYAKEQFPDMQWKDGAEVTEEELMNAAGVWNFQEYIRRQLQDSSKSGCCSRFSGSGVRSRSDRCV